MEQQKQRKVRIVNDGCMGWQSKITDAETGEALPYLRVDEIHITMRDTPHAILHCQKPMIDVIADVQMGQNVCPECGRPWEQEEEV